MSESFINWPPSFICRYCLMIRWHDRHSKSCSKGGSIYSMFKRLFSPSFFLIFLSATKWHFVASKMTESVCTKFLNQHKYRRGGLDGQIMNRNHRINLHYISMLHLSTRYFLTVRWLHPLFFLNRHNIKHVDLLHSGELLFATFGLLATYVTIHFTP